MLRITKQADYAIVLLGQFLSSTGGITYTARDLSAATRIPLPMVGKILKALVHHELLTSQRGVKGGYHLARPAESITVAQVIEAMDGPIALTTCELSTGDCEHETRCGVRPNWARINSAILTTLKGITLAEMIRSTPAPQAPLPPSSLLNRFRNSDPAGSQAAPPLTKETV